MSTKLQPTKHQGLDIRSTPRAEMKLYPLDTFAYEFPGKEIKINFEIPEFTCICPFSDFPDFAVLRIVGERIRTIARVDFRNRFQRREIDHARFVFLSVG